MRKAFEQIWSEKGIPAWLLFPASLLYQVGWLSYASIYRYGLKRAHIPAIPTICIGNLTAGGSGKTPFTLEIARNLNARGIPTIIGTSGYGSPRYHGATRAPDGPLPIATWGDEATMLRYLEPDIPLIVGHDRVRAAQIAAEEFPESVLLMDDGFQHLRLQPDFAYIIDSEPDNDFCFPAGPYREPRWYGNSRADIVLTYGHDLIAQPVELSHHGQPFAKGQTVNVLCAVAQPHRFVDSLRLAGFTVKDTLLLADHDPLNALDLLRDFDPKIPLVVTAKDYVKLKERQNLDRFRIAVAHYRVTPRNEDDFYATIIDKINELRQEKAGQ